MVGGSKSRPYWTFACESCMRCMGYCPNKAVEVSHVSREYSIIALITSGGMSFLSNKKLKAFI